ncbi:MAG: GtrA family protein [Sphingobium sp.]
MRAFAAPVAALAARFMLARYLLASVCALSSDMLLFLGLGHAGASPVLAAFGGYAGGLVVHWAISSRYVFATGGRATHAQRAGFVASALVGMGITMGSVGALTALGIIPAVAKLLTVPASFFAVYAIRKYGVFASR